MFRLLFKGVEKLEKEELERIIKDCRFRLQYLQEILEILERIDQGGLKSQDVEKYNADIKVRLENLQRQFKNSFKQIEELEVLEKKREKLRK